MLDPIRGFLFLQYRHDSHKRSNTQYTRSAFCGGIVTLFQLEAIIMIAIDHGML